jgi:mannose-6-phosphate isomerase-like protein (cupin superfamily)
MRLLITGVDELGRSCIVDEVDVDPTAIEALPGTAVATLFATSESPPPPRQPALGTRLEDRLAPGLVHWFLVTHAPRAGGDEATPATELHHRNAIDLVVVLEGTGDLILGDGHHPVRAGDCIVMPGTDHGLRPGPDGCRLMSFAVGTPPPDRSV